MARYHLNNDGNPGVCRAVHSCPFGDLTTEHYPSKEVAALAFERKMASEVVPSTAKKATIRRSPLKRLSLKRADLEETGELARLEHVHRPAKKRLARTALVAAALVALTACNGPQAQEEVPYDPYITDTQTSQTATPAVEDVAPVESTTASSAESMMDNLKEKYTEVKERYNNDWRDKITEKIDEYDSYVDGYVPEAPSDQGYSKYDRKAFKHWSDLDRNSCDTRQDILQRDLKAIKLDSDGCTVLSGSLPDPYTGKTIRYERGNNSVDIDHVAPLSWAWEAGAHSWSDAKREQFANDPANLLAVQSSANRSKGDSSPKEWMPINHKKACEYGTQFLSVAKKYNLKVSPDDLSSVKLACE